MVLCVYSNDEVVCCDDEFGYGGDESVYRDGEAEYGDDEVLNNDGRLCMMMRQCMMMVTIRLFKVMYEDVFGNEEAVYCNERLCMVIMRLCMGIIRLYCR